MHVYDALMTTGRDYGIINAGYQAIRFLRTEKFHVSWGDDFDRWTTPIECGTAFRVKFQVCILKFKTRHQQGTIK